MCWNSGASLTAAIYMVITSGFLLWRQLEGDVTYVAFLLPMVSVQLSEALIWFQIEKHPKSNNYFVKSFNLFLTSVIYFSQPIQPLAMAITTYALGLSDSPMGDQQLLLISSIAALVLVIFLLYLFLKKTNVIGGSWPDQRGSQNRYKHLDWHIKWPPVITPVNWILTIWVMWLVDTLPAKAVYSSVYVILALFAHIYLISENTGMSVFGSTWCFAIGAVGASRLLVPPTLGNIIADEFSYAVVTAVTSFVGLVFMYSVWRSYTLSKSNDHLQDVQEDGLYLKKKYNILKKPWTKSQSFESNS